LDSKTPNLGFEASYITYYNLFFTVKYLTEDHLQLMKAAKKLSDVVKNESVIVKSQSVVVKSGSADLKSESVDSKYQSVIIKH
jgi:hypothetical protein